jgi:hypothetical protein
MTAVQDKFYPALFIFHIELFPPTLTPRAAFPAYNESD